MCVAGVMAQTSDEPVVLRKVQNAQLVLVKDQIKLVLFTDKSGNSLSHLNPNFEIWVDRRQWTAMEDLLLRPSSKAIRLAEVDGKGLSVVRATGIDSAGLLFYVYNKFVNVREEDFFYLGGVFFDENDQNPNYNRHERTNSRSYRNNGSTYRNSTETYRNNGSTYRNNAGAYRDNTNRT